MMMDLANVQQDILEMTVILVILHTLCLTLSMVKIHVQVSDGMFKSLVTKYNSILIEMALECTCNRLGSTKSDDSACDNKCCNDDGTCKCTIGYSGNDCNSCDIGYYVSDTVNNENNCTGMYPLY